MRSVGVVVVLMMPATTTTTTGRGLLDYCQTQNKGRTLDSGWTVVKTSCMTFQLTSGMVYLTKLPKFRKFCKNVTRRRL